MKPKKIEVFAAGGRATARMTNRDSDVYEALTRAAIRLHPNMGARGCSWHSDGWMEHTDGQVVRCYLGTVTGTPVSRRLGGGVPVLVENVRGYVTIPAQATGGTA